MLYGVEAYDKLDSEWVFDGYAALFRNWYNAVDYAANRSSEDTYYHVVKITEEVAKAGGIYNLLRD